MVFRIKNKIERNFEAFGHLLYHHHFKAIFAVFIVIAILLSGLSDLRIDTSTESFLHDNDPALLDYNAFRDQFGRDEMLIIAIQPPEVFSQPFLRKLKALHDDLKQNVPHLDDITSLINVRNTRGEEDQLIVEDLLQDLPRDAAAMQALKTRVLNHPLYKNLLISEDGRFTTIVIKTESTSSNNDSTDILAGFDEPAETHPSAQDTRRPRYLSDEENSAVVSAAQAISARYRSADFPIYIAGSPVITDTLKRAMMHDMSRFMGMALLTIGALLFLLFRRVSGVLLPLGIVVLSLLSTMGLMGWFGAAIKLPTTVIPSFLLAIGVGTSVHILTVFYRNLHDHDDREAAIAHALGHSGLAITMAGFTTAAGLISFSNAEIAPIAELGQYAAAGALLSLLYTIVLLPALLAMIPIRRKEGTTEQDRHAVMDRLLVGIAGFANRRAWLIIGISTLLTAVALIGALRLNFSHNPLAWLPEETAIFKTTQLIDHELKGTTSMELVFDTGRENGLHDPRFLNKLDAFSQELATTRDGELFIAKAMSLADTLKEINQALNENRPEFYTIPQDRQLIAQELLLFENSGSDDLEDIVDSQFSKARLISKLPWLDAVAYSHFLLDLKTRVTEEFAGLATVTITGIMPLLARTIGAAINSMAESYVIAIIAVTLMMILMIGNLRMGLISMAPNLIPIIFTLGLMGWIGLPLDMFTMLIGSIAIGMVVDDTIHFMHNFQRYFQQSNNVVQAIEQTLHSTGRAMLVTSVVLVLGFFIFMFASMNNLFNFGLLTGITVAMALLADFLLAPALVTVFARPLSNP